MALVKCCSFEHCMPAFAEEALHACLPRVGTSRRCALELLFELQQWSVLC